MKKRIYLALGSLVFSATVLANPNIMAKTTFAPVNWMSTGTPAPQDTITITNNDPSHRYAVEIYVSQMNPGFGLYDAQITGVNVKNCGATTHINAGSSALCFVGNEPISFIADKATTDAQTFIASGVYQIERLDV